MSIARTAVYIIATAVAALLAGCSSVPTGRGAYLLRVSDAASGRPVEGLTLLAAGTGTTARGEKPAMGVTDEDGSTVMAFGDWGSIDLQLVADDAALERWLVTQRRVAVNGGRSSSDPLRLMVGADGDGGVARFRVSITRIEKGPPVDN